MSQNTLTATLKTHFPHLRMEDEADMLTEYGQDWTRFYQPAPTAVIFPKSIEDVQNIVRFAVKHSLAIVPSGGRTGLSGGAVAERGELVISFDAMNEIRSFNQTEQTVVCEAGVVTAHRGYGDCCECESTLSRVLHRLGKAFGTLRNHSYS